MANGLTSPATAVWPVTRVPSGVSRLIGPAMVCPSASRLPLVVGTWPEAGGGLSGEELAAPGL
jgi:hypothetical protein